MADEQTPEKQAPSKLTKEERSKILSAAAKERWERERKAKAKAAKAASKPSRSRKGVSGPREFSSALKTAEKRLAKAILERAEAAAKYAVVSAEIPSLQRIILALKNPMGMMEFPGTASYGGIVSAPTLEQIVGDQPLSYANPPRYDIPAQPPPPQVPRMPVPQELHPANTLSSRGGGGAIGVELPVEGDGGAEEDENKFLNESTVAGGAWH
jgi:hypothetical protein